MLRLISLFILLTPLFCNAQGNLQIQQKVDSLRKTTIIDGNDKTGYQVFDDLFEEMLQADTINQQMPSIKKVGELLRDEKSRNSHLIKLFFGYQNYISNPQAKNNSKFQVDLIEALNMEVNEIYGKLPVILYIYQAEAYNADKRYKEAETLVDNAREIYPNAIPLKVYQAMAKKDESLKQEVIKANPNHWMVQLRLKESKP